MSVTMEKKSFLSPSMTTNLPAFMSSTFCSGSSFISSPSTSEPLVITPICFPRPAAAGTPLRTCFAIVS